MNKKSHSLVLNEKKIINKEINQKNHKKKKNKTKDKENKINKNKTQEKQEQNTEINDENSKENVNDEKDNQKIIVKGKSKNININISNNKKVIKTGIRFFGKEIDNVMALDERLNQYIIRGEKYKKNFNKNLLLNPENIFELPEIEYIKQPQYVIDYRVDIFETLIQEENNYVPDYYIINNIIPGETRIKYILFLIQVCDKITKKEEIHYLSINIFDRVISQSVNDKNSLTEKKLQLICFTSLFIAYKYETGCYFLIEDLISHTEDSLVTREEVLNYEYEINSILNYNYLIVYPSHFLKHYDLIDNIHNQKVYYFCLYLLDFILSDTNLMSHKKSLISASCYYIAKANLLKIDIWPNMLQFVTGYQKEEVKNFAIKIIHEMKNSKNSNLFKFLRKKYSKDEYDKVIEYIINKK